MIATLRFSIPDERYDLDAALNGRAYLSSILNIQAYVENIRKHTEMNDQAAQIVENIAAFIREEMQELQMVDTTIEETKDNNMNGIQADIIKFRVKKKWKQEWMAVMLGVSQSYLSKVENGTRMPNKKLMEAFNKLMQDEE
jgi:ribosome-binding protein aMBF1 (putative translation factor)